ncbi:MAG: hydrolase [Opitutaceae bacterium]|nr:hydrolase [Opitutaceae bacterium]
MTLPSAIARLPERTTEFGALLVRWAEINSGSGHLAGLNRMRAALRDEFGKIPGAQLEELPCHGTLAALRVSVRPEAKTRFLLSGHFDTVYEANDPFQRCRWLDAERLNGPGVTDMKGGLITTLAALQTFEGTPHAANVGWDALLTPDEETGSRGSAHLFREAPARVQFGLVFEPARPNGDIVHSRKGTGGIVATCRGRAAHAAKIPNDGRNAILALAEFVLAASRIPAEQPGVLLNIGNIRGGGPATNVVPDFARSELDLRITKVADREPLLARLHALADEINRRDGYKLELSGGFNRPPKECLPLEEKVFPEWQRAAHDVGVAPFTWVHTGGASDGNLLTAAGLPNLDGLGPIGDQLHSDREFIIVPTIAQRAQVAALFLHRVAAGEIRLAG